MGRATALLIVRGALAVPARRRVVMAVVALAALAAWDALAGRLPALADRADVLLVAAVLIPTTLLAVWLLAPLAPARGLALLTGATAVLAVLLDLADAGPGFNVTKVALFALVGFCFLQLFELLSWVVLVAFVIPWVDIVSVYRGPTKVVVEQEPGLFERIAVAFAVPGEDAAARLGPPDVVFFALFLAAAIRFGLRARATWLSMTAAISATLVATYAFDLQGLPALPAVAIGFLAPNADLLWRELRPAGRRGRD